MASANCGDPRWRAQREARRSEGQSSAEGVGWTKGIRHLGLSVREGKNKRRDNLIYIPKKRTKLKG